MQSLYESFNKVATTGTGNLTRARYALGNETTATYEGMGLFMTSLTNAKGHVTNYHYHGVNAFGDANSWLGMGTFGQLQAVRDPNDARTFYSYDPFGRLKTVAQPGDSLAWPTQEYFYIDKNGTSDVNATAFAPPLMIQTFQRKNATVGVNAYGAQGYWWTCTSCGADLNALAFWSREHVDGLGCTIQTQKPAADWPTVNNRAVSYVQYDLFGRAATASVPYDVADTAPYWSTPDAGKPRTVTLYDALNRATSVTAPDGTVTTKLYYLWSGWQVNQTIDAKGHLKQHLTNALGQLRKVRDHSGNGGSEGGYVFAGDVTYTYDYAGNLTQVVDHASNTTTLTYDRLNRKTQMVDPDMGTWSYGYDANGNLTSQTDARGWTMTFGYDMLNRMTAKYVNGALDSEYWYDETSDGAWNTNMQNTKGRRTAMLKTGQNWIRFYYDGRGRTTQTRHSVDGMFNTYYAYDSADRVTQMTYPTGERVATTYSSAGNPISLNSLDWTTTPGGSFHYVTGASYNALGQLRDLNLGNGQQERRRYWGQGLDFVFPPYNNVNYAYGRLRQICITGQSAGACTESMPAPQAMNVSYDYDAVGNLRNIGDWGRSEVPAFAYDHLDRLTGVSGAYTENYTYNAIGNLTSKTGLGNFEYFASANWNCPGGPHAVRHIPGVNGYCYDPNGNMQWRYEGGNLWLQTWDADNKLQTVQQKSTADWATNIGGPTNFYYDADGNRVKRVGPSGPTLYIGDHTELIPNVKWTHYYTFNRLRVAVRDGASGPVSWLHGDLLGSASVATNSSGGKIANSEQRFTPYGSPRLSASGLPTDKTFTGQRVEAGIGGIMDFNARFYDPLIGRFLSADTIVPGAGNPQALNRYAYGFNSPLKYTDPDGHCPMPSAEVGGGGIICFASFIPTPTAQGPGGAIFKGDDRGFSPRSDLTKSKMFIWLNVDTKQVWVGTNASHVALPISPDFGPSPDNKATVSFDEATGEYTIEYEAVIAYPSSDETAARINGTIKFRPDGKGGYESSGERDRYPAAEAYFWSDNPSLNPKAQVQPIFRRLAGQGIQNLYGVEKNPTWLRDRVRDIVTYAAQPEPIDKWSYPSNSCQPGRPC